MDAGVVITERGRRAIHVLAAVALGLLLLALSAAATGSDEPGDRWMGLEPEAALAEAPCPSPTSVALPTVSPSTLADARERRFEVFGPKPTELPAPIDWHTDPLGAERYRQNLHKLRFLGALLSTYAADGNVDDLRLATDIAIDWVRNNPRGERETAQEAWGDKVVGDRVPYLAYVLRAAACEDALTAAERRDLLAAMAEHGAVLAADRNYTPDNHGLFVDLGLARLTAFLPFLDEAERWRGLARERFEATLRKRLSQGMWLEHSSAYQFLAIRPLDSMLNVIGADAELEALRDEMRAAAAWFVRPDGELTQFGDSNLEPVPEWALGAEPGTRAFFGAGFAFVRAPGPEGDLGYLAVTAGFHNLTHKHADELSFELFDRGIPIVNDTGLYHKDPGAIRDYVLSNRAHSGLTVDGLDLPIADLELAYGSGLVAGGEGDGWYAIEGRNPLVEPQGVTHSRLFLYRPGVALVIVDDLRAQALHTYTRYLQLHPEIELGDSDEIAIQINGPGFAGAVYDAPGDNPAERSQVRDQKLPLQGLTSPDFREWLPRWTLSFTDTASTETRALAIALDQSALRATGARADGATTTVELADAAGTASTVEVVRDRRRLAVTAAP